MYVPPQPQAKSTTPPAVDDLPLLDPYERDILLARAKQAQKKRKRSQVRAAVELPDIVHWIEANCYDADKCRNPEKPLPGIDPLIVLTAEQKRILRKCFTIDPRTGRFPYRTIVYSAPKKSGKSGIGGCIAAWYAANVEAPNAVLSVANDREQSSGRVYKAAKPTLYGIGGQKEGKYRINLPNGSYIQAVTSDPEKEAGGTYGATVWDELWAYKSERAQLLWEELRPIPTRTNSIRVIVTYAGFENSSDLLLAVYKHIFANTKETELAEGARPVEELKDIVTTDGEGNTIPCCYENPDKALFYYNDHEQRMPWQQGEHGEALAREAIAETPEATYRLTFNRWQFTENPFVSKEAIAASFNRAQVEPGLPNLRPMTIGIDAGWRNDTSAVVGTFAEGTGETERFITGFAKCWAPKKELTPEQRKAGVGFDLDLIVDEIMGLWRQGLVATRPAEQGEKAMVTAEKLTPIDVWYDETQMHQLMNRLRLKYKLLPHKFDQKRPRVLADTFLQTVYTEQRIDNLDYTELLSHLQAAKAETQLDANRQVIRIVKSTGTGAKPNDLVVAQSMSVYRCSLRPRTVAGGIAMGAAKGWQPKRY